MFFNEVHPKIISFEKNVIVIKFRVTIYQQKIAHGPQNREYINIFNYLFVFHMSARQIFTDLYFHLFKSIYS